MVALVELGLDVAGLRRIDHGLVEVDDAVELAAVADELVDGQPDRLLLRRVVALERRAGEGIAERRQRRADDAHAVGMGTCDQLPVAGEDVVGGRLRIVQGEAGARPADVVDAHHQDHRVGMRLAQHVALEAGERIDAHAVAQHLGARNALVEHGDRRAAAIGQPLRQMVRPAVVAVDGRAVAVGDGIAERHDGARILPAHPPGSPTGTPAASAWPSGVSAASATLLPAAMKAVWWPSQWMVWPAHSRGRTG